jgi:hypothetical protein
LQEITEPNNKAVLEAAPAWPDGGISTTINDNWRVNKIYVKIVCGEISAGAEGDCFCRVAKEAVKKLVAVGQAAVDANDVDQYRFLHAQAVKLETLLSRLSCNIAHHEDKIESPGNHNIPNSEIFRY